MLSLLRQGARSLIIRTGKIDLTAEWLKTNLPLTEYQLKESINRAEPDQTVVILSSTWKVEDSYSSFVVDRYAEEMIQILFNYHPDLPVDISLRLLPRFIHFRVTGNPEPIIEQIEKDFNGVRGKLDELLYDTSDKGIAVLFTDKPLNRNLYLEHHFKDILYINMPAHLLLRHLQWRAVSYFNEGLDEKEWNLVEIRIYDTYSRYLLHCRRLRLFLEACEMGLTIGEGWGRDYAHILMPLRVYTMKILTFYPPKVLKRALMGLEYSEEGERFVDLDLYFNRRKIGWTELTVDRNKNREENSMDFRKSVMDNLTDLHKQEIRSIEKDILKQQRG